uniref:Uncharacterized protein n=1 Tax=Oryza brachyantha TaxID=4533 RepID=J3NDD6_ORYBR
MIIPADITADPRYKNHHPLINPSIPISSSAAFAISFSKSIPAASIFLSNLL